MARGINAIALALLLVCAGCTTDSQAPAAFAAVPGQASVTITRSSSLMYMGAPASVTINGAKVADLGVGQSYSGALSPGPAIITVSAWSSAGATSTRINVEPGKAYRLAVTPRTENTTAGILGGTIGQAAEGGGPFMVSAE